MTSPVSAVVRLVRELKRRKVYRVTTAYVVLALGGLEALDLIIPSTRLPEWAHPFFLGLAVVGLPVVVAFAWTFDITADGVVRTDPSERPSDIEAPPAQPLSKVPEIASQDLDPLVVAVLPFGNLSGSEEAEPFAAGLHDDLLTELSRASSLTVISRTSVQAYRGTYKSVREIGLELGAGTLVEAGVQLASTRVRLNVQLIDARTDTHRWAERFDRQLSPETIFDLQTDLATRIMEELQARLTETELVRTPAAPTSDLEAYRLYAMGRQQYVRRDEEAFRRAASFFERALDRDPAFAGAWAGLGMSLVGLLDYGYAEGEGVLDRGREACDRALALDPGLPEANAAKGVLETYLHNGAEARRALAKAREYGPGLALGHQWAAWVDLLTGRPEAALAASRRATRLDPLDPEARGNLAVALVATGDTDEASAQARRILEAHPGFDYALLVLGMSLQQQRRTREGRAAWREMRGSQFHRWGVLADGLTAMDEGDRAEAHRRVVELEAEGAAFQAGVLLGALGDTDRCFEAIREDLPLFWDAALTFRYSAAPPLDRLRDDSRYAEVLVELDRHWGLESDSSA